MGAPRARAQSPRESPEMVALCGLEGELRVHVHLRESSDSQHRSRSLYIGASALERSSVLRGLSRGIGSDEAVSLGISASAFEAWLDIVNDRSPRPLKWMTAPQLRQLLQVAVALGDAHTAAAACADIADLLFFRLGRTQHSAPLHRLQKATALGVLEGLPPILQAAIIEAAPSSNLSALLATLPFWAAFTALKVHAAAAATTSAAPAVRTWLEGTGLHLSATFAPPPHNPAAAPHVSTLELTGLLPHRPSWGAARHAYADGDMATLIRSICSHRGLEELSLSGVRLGPESAAALRAGLPAMYALRRLEVCNTGADLHDPALGGVALQQLHLSHVRAGPGACDAGGFAAQLTNMEQLTALSLTSCRLGVAGWRHVIAKVSELPYLHTLVLERNRHLREALWEMLVAESMRVDDGIDAPATLLRWPSLELLSLSSCSSHTAEGKSSVATIDTIACGSNAGLVAFVQGLTGLTSLTLAQAGLDGEDAAAAVAPLRRLRALKLLGNRVNGAGMRALAPRLPHLEHLSSLDLSLNQLGDEGAAALAATAPFLHQLEVCKLCHNGIGDTGAREVFAAVTAVRALRDLRLVMNSITDSVALDLAAALPRLRSLESVHLHHNAVGRAAQAAVRSSARSVGCDVRF